VSDIMKEIIVWSSGEE